MPGFMSTAVILQHVEHSPPGRIVGIFRDFGIPVEVRRLDRGDDVPLYSPEIRLLVSLGGSMRVSDVGSPEHPFLAKEVELLRQMIAADRPVLGIALGAQLLAHAAGARVHPNVKPADGDESPTPLPEHGWGPVTFPFPGGTEPIVYGLNDGTFVFHWHEDTFELPRLPAPPPTPGSPPPPTGSVLLSSSARCKNQAFRFKNRLFGFQYHFEFTEADIQQVLATQSEPAARLLGPDGAARVREETRRHYPRYERLGDRILRNFVQYLKVY
jgi:GMP synthase (glutamine-hydrolysing)